MIYKEDSVDIIRDLVASLSFPVVISSVNNDGGGNHTLEVCDMYHAQPLFPLTIDGKVYKITDITPGTRPSCGSATKDVIKVKGDASTITANSFEVYKPFFFHNTPIAQGVEMAQENKELDKIPMCWLYEQFTEDFDNDPMSNLEREIKFRLFFLTHGDPEKWLSDQAYKEAVKPMRRLAQVFIDKINSKAWRFDVDTMKYTITNYAKFGVFIANRGMDKQLWHDKVAGCELSMSLTVFKDEGCDECES